MAKTPGPAPTYVSDKYRKGYDAIDWGSKEKEKLRRRREARRKRKIQMEEFKS